MFGEIKIIDISLNKTKSRIKKKCRDIDSILNRIENDFQQKNYELKTKNSINLENIQIITQNKMMGNLIDSLNLHKDTFTEQIENAKYLKIEKETLAKEMKKLGKHFHLIKECQGIEVIAKIKNLIREKNFKEISNVL